MKNKSILQSFKNAWNGICQAFRSERNMKIHLVATILVIVTGIILNLDKISWIALTFAIGLVLICELLNTAIEKLTDMVTDEFSERAGKVKDISASAVMVSAFVSVIIGILVFIEPLIGLFM